MGKFHKENRFKRFLERNKIYFETIAALTLSFMAAFVSIKSNSIAEKQNNFSEAALQPEFRLGLLRADIDSLNFRTNSSFLNVYLINGHYDNLEIKIISRLEVNYNIPKKGWETFHIYVNGFYMSSFPGDRVNGLIETHGNHNNQVEFDEFKWFVSDYINSKGYDLMPYQSSFLELMYNDKAGVSHKYYYNISFKEGVVISNEEGKSIFQEDFDCMIKDEKFKIYDLNNQKKKVIDYIDKQLLK